MSDGPIVALENATKRYGGIAALENANFELFPGEIHALVGENGAGKSTLCKLIAGVLAPTEGSLWVDRHPVAFSAPKDASRLGISMVFQETSLVPQLTVAQNIALGRERAFNSVRKVRNTARQALKRLNFNVDASQLAGALSAAKRQMVEIARAVLNDARVIIFDEPTAALTPEETEHLFNLMKILRKRGVAMIFISHALEEALTNADRITVLRNGRVMATGPARDLAAYAEQVLSEIAARAPRQKNELKRTLLVYFDAQHNVKRTAETLGLHINTVRQRLEALREITGGWDDPVKALEMHVALRLNAILA